MANVIKTLHEQTNLPYKIMVEGINDILIEMQSDEEMKLRTLIHYANGDFYPKKRAIIKALAKYFELSPTALIENLKSNRETA